MNRMIIAVPRSRWDICVDKFVFAPAAGRA
jgi:hypothetical protein